MEPLKIEIQIGLKDETISAVKQLLLASIAAFMETVNACQGKPVEAAEVQAQEEAPSAEEKAAEPAPAAGDMPDFTEAFPEVSDKEIAEVTRATVVRLREAGINPTVIRKEVFEKYGINQSTECPMEKRGQLLADLNALGK